MQAHIVVFWLLLFALAWQVHVMPWLTPEEDVCALLKKKSVIVLVQSNLSGLWKTTHGWSLQLDEYCRLVICCFSLAPHHTDDL